MSEQQLDGFRQELSHPAGGLPSYPHPRLMPDFWQFPTVSMGLGPMNAIYQAQFNKYLQNRGIKDTSQQRVWAFLGDGEMDEPESRGLLQVAVERGARQPHLRHQLQPAAARRPGARQRQDHPGARVALPRRRLERHQGRVGPRVGPAAGQGQRRRAGAPDELHARTATTRPTGPRTARSSASTSSGATRAPARWSRTSATTRSGRSSAAATTTARCSRRTRPRPQHTGQPTVILAKTIKGYGLGANFAGRNATHQMKKLTLDDLKTFRDGLRIPISDEQLEAEPVPARRTTTRAPDSEETQYLLERRRALGGSVPQRRTRSVGRSRCRATTPTSRRRRAPASSRSPRRWRSSGSSRT